MACFISITGVSIGRMKGKKRLGENRGWHITPSSYVGVEFGFVAFGIVPVDIVQGWKRCKTNMVRLDTYDLPYKSENPGIDSRQESREGRVGHLVLCEEWRGKCMVYRR
jgi:hypothetical protein